MIQKATKTFMLCFVIASFWVQSAHAQQTSEYEVKAAFLFNFIKFIEWPGNSSSETNAPIVIGVLGNDPFFNPNSSVNYLDETIIGKTINERKIVIRRFKKSADVGNCHLLFIGKTEEALKNILANLRGRSILTVSEAEKFCQRGGMINFIMLEGKVRFEINIGAAENAGLKVSSKLLKVAKIVSTEPR